MDENDVVWAKVVYSCSWGDGFRLEQGAIICGRINEYGDLLVIHPKYCNGRVKKLSVKDGLNGAADILSPLEQLARSLEDD